ncbi:MAG: GAF domain-containing protein, partial [Candidatus Melainabacteria bacterium]|nr:GAF domain-containing protein [Candidatus Melainabacteria bacterium]
MSELKVLSFLATPILLKGSELGLIGIHHCKQIHHWSHDEIDLVETVAAQLGVLIQSSNVLKEQEKLANSLATMNQDLSKLYVELAAKDEQIDRFMHLISHDLRAPIVAIEGLVDLLKQMFKDEPAESKLRRYLDLISKSTTQITGLTAALLDYARLGQSTLHLEQVDTAELVREIWARCTLGVSNIDLEIFGTLPVVHADRARLTQVFQNILENAVKYRRLEGQAMVDITCQESENFWQFAVNDNGIG